MLVLIWTGRGYWAALFPIVFLGVLGMAVTFTFGEATLDANAWIYGVALIAAAFATWVCGRRWNGTTGVKPWDLRTLFRRRRPHRVFALPMELWSAPLAFSGVWIVVASLVSRFF
ncbi:MAG TPA: hypothetical protein VHW60_01000 [Caulobacteraceae bacterium]|jgi:hypothetical protein|nr:hypothetical protein [Caulobacteraceae bacterium]